MRGQLAALREGVAVRRPRGHLDEERRTKQAKLFRDCTRRPVQRSGTSMSALPPEVILLIADWMCSAPMFCRFGASCKEWHSLIAASDWLWKRPALDRFPRLGILLTLSSIAIPSFRQLYRGQLSAERPMQSALCEGRGSLSDFMCTVEFHVCISSVGHQKLLSTTTAPLTFDPERHMVPFAQAWTAATRHIVPMLDVRGLQCLSLSSRFDLILNVYISKQLQTLRIYHGTSYEHDDKTLVFPQSALCESAAQTIHAHP